jgi:catechol 2,3-dioxygenase-like lactoylglutathione lyase family enzyme
VIIGVAQLIVNAADPDAAAGALEASGYARKWTERALPNHPAKAPLQGAPREALDLVFLTPPEPGVAIEVTGYHGPAPAGRAAYRWDGATATAVVSDAPASRAFWSELGFREGADGALEFPAPVASLRLRLALEERPGVEPGTVDADGCVVVALLSTDAAADARGAETWTETVDGRDLKVGMLRGPGGEPIEMLQLPRTRT